MKDSKSLLVVFKADDLDDAIKYVKDMEYATIEAGSVSLADADCPGKFVSSLFTKKKTKEGFIFYDPTAEDYNALYGKDKETGLYYYDLAIAKDVVDLNSLPDYVLLNEEAEEVGSFVDSRMLFKDFNHENLFDSKNIDLLLEVIKTSYNKCYVAMLECTKIAKEEE